MAELVSFYKTTDGQLFEKQEDADRHELDCLFIEKLVPLYSKAFDGKEDVRRSAEQCRKELGGWVVRNQLPLRDILNWYILEKEALSKKTNKVH